MKMSMSGLKKQFHKASQLLSEKISGEEGTKLDDEFIEMERKTTVTNKCLIELQSRTIEYLQPNPASRAKLSMLQSVSRVRGQVKSMGYPQTEGLLGVCMLRYGLQLGHHSLFGSALVDTGEALRQVAALKDDLDINIKHNFIDPLHDIQENELREIMNHLKKMEGRRLDLDYKRKRQGRISDQEIKQALEKFEESKSLAERSMFYFLEKDVQQLNQLSALMEAALDYHRQSHCILEDLRTKLETRVSSASQQPKREFRPKSMRSSFESISRHSSAPPTPVDHVTSVHSSWPGSPTTLYRPHQMDQPCCRSLYDFDPQNEGELGFKAGDLIILTNQIDQHWYEGMINGDSGFFPINYVKVIVPLPH
ncbi:endophilin-A3a isoform X1 [Gouania willdenowi]|uniref:endophilin-A3a isoform X1 n=1 Tax=Gouania willdenowi TaxID=441366 RepID=UPI00105503CF|nr:endophilin-A3-like isoform X1 [Gouania willdenowi]